MVADERWGNKHLRTLSSAYRKAPHFKEVASWLFPLLEDLARESLLTKANERPGIVTPIRRSTDILDRREMCKMDRVERIVALCRAAGASRFLCGPAAAVYLDKQVMLAAGLMLEWMDYSGYPDYQQLWGRFEPNVSIVDLLFNTGDRARDYLECKSSLT